jgi:hypothetical protein
MHNIIKTRQLLEQLSSLVLVNKLTSNHGYFIITSECGQNMTANIFSLKEVNNHEKNTF